MDAETRRRLEAIRALLIRASGWGIAEREMMREAATDLSALLMDADDDGPQQPGEVSAPEQADAVRAALAEPVLVKPEPHQCSGCGHRWEGHPGPMLCGDCWRNVQPVLHVNRAGAPPLPTRQAPPRGDEVRGASLIARLRAFKAVTDAGRVEPLMREAAETLAAAQEFVTWANTIWKDTPDGRHAKELADARAQVLAKRIMGPSFSRGTEAHDD